MAPFINEEGFAVLPVGKQNPTWVVDKYGNMRADGQVSVGSLVFASGGTTGEVLQNNEFLSGLTTANVVKRLIGVNASNVVSIDPDDAGVVFGSTISATTITATTAFLGPNGSVGTPTYSFTNDPDSGWYSTGGGQVSLALDGSSRLTFNYSSASPFLQGVVGGQSINWNSDGTLQLAPGATNKVEIRNGTTAQTLNIYGTYTSGTNLEALQLIATGSTYDISATSGSGGGAIRNLRIANKSQAFWQWDLNGGTGSYTPISDNIVPIGDVTHRVSTVYALNLLSGASNLEIQSGTGAQVFFGANATRQWTMDTSGNLRPNTLDNTFNVGGVGLTMANVFSTIFTVGTTTSIATSGSIRSAHNNQWVGRDSTNANNRNVIAWGVTTTDTVIVGDANVATNISCNAFKVNGFTGLAAYSGLVTTNITVRNGIVTAVS